MRCKINSMKALFESARPRHWIKNVLLFVGLFFSQNILNVTLLIKSVLSFVLFCFVTSAVYIINDIADINRDKAHPVKSKRPLASGRLTIKTAVTSAIILISITLPLSILLDFQFGLVVLGYFVLILLYSFMLKNIVILDVIVIAVGFILRPVAGAIAINVEISSWLLICTTFLALFLAISKRRNELLLLKKDSVEHRKILREYDAKLLDQMIGAVTACTIMSYALYTTSQETITKFGTRDLIFTLPFVLYGVFRYLYLVYHKNYGGSPELIFFKDFSMIVNIFLFIIVVILVLYL